MNDLNPWENQLASWTPRNPSPRIRRRLFTAPAIETEGRRGPAMAWLPAAAAACAFLVTGWLALPHGARGVAAAASGGSNLLASLTLPDSSCQQWNLWSAVSFDWTKLRGSLSVSSPSGVGNTNL